VYRRHAAPQINRPAQHGNQERDGRLVDLDVMLQNDGYVPDDEHEHDKQALPADDLHDLTPDLIFFAAIVGKIWDILPDNFFSFYLDFTNISRGRFWRPVFPFDS